MGPVDLDAGSIAWLHGRICSKTRWCTPGVRNLTYRIVRISRRRRVGIRWPFMDDFGVGIPVNEAPDVARGSMVVDVDGEEIVGARFEERVTVSRRQRAHLRSGVCDERGRRSARLSSLTVLVRSGRLPASEDLARCQSPAGGLVADAETKGQRIDVLGDGACPSSARGAARMRAADSAERGVRT